MALLHLHPCLLFLAFCHFNGNWVERGKKGVLSLSRLSAVLYSSFSHSFFFFLSLLSRHSISIVRVYVLSFSSFTIIIDLIERVDDKAKQI